MIPQFFDDKIPHNGLTYSDFYEITETKISEPYSGPNEGTKELFEYIKLNFQRAQRIHKTYKVSNELKVLIKKIGKPQIWMVITEDWCGDSAQNLPYISMIADENPLIDLRIVLRDSNLDIMDLYLTNGTSRSIPKLVAFDLEGNELFQWGPRPAEAQQIVENGKNKNLNKNEYLEQLHLWYGRNRGESIEAEFKEILKKIR